MELDSSAVVSRVLMKSTEITPVSVRTYVFFFAIFETPYICEMYDQMIHRLTVFLCTHASYMHAYTQINIATRII